LKLKDWETDMKLCEFIDQPILDKETPSPEALCYRYQVSLDEVFDQMFVGMIVELEHTSNVMAAMEIALDHLGESLNYYGELSDIHGSDDPEVDENRSRIGKPGKKRKKIYPGQSSAMLANYVARKYGGQLGCGRAAQIVNDPDVNKNIRKRAIWYRSLHCRGRKQVRERSSSCEL
jgi:hypothetical protein